MGTHSLFCCFRNKNPLCIALIGLTTNVIIFGVLIWPAVKLVFFRTGIEAVFWIGFVLNIICLIIFILITLFLCLKQNPSYNTLRNIAKILCLVALGVCFVAWVFILAAFIGALKDYVDAHDMLTNDESDFDADEWDWKIGNVINKSNKRNMLDDEDFDPDDIDDLDLDDDESDLSSFDWATATFPFLLDLAGLVLIALCANYLYKVFKDDSVIINQKHVNPNVTSTDPVVPQPQLFPNNAQNYPVVVQ